MVTPDSFDVIVIGGGAAGFFGAINMASINPKLRIAILEKSNRLLTKVRISGGGRCNVTHHCYEPTPLSKHYPRGQQELKKLYRVFQASDVVKWFEVRGVDLKIEKDGRIFPATDNSETIINCFASEADQLGIQIISKSEVVEVRENLKGFIATASDKKAYTSEKILIAMGGHAQESKYKWIEELGHKIAKPIPSLFTFNDSVKQFRDLMGISVSEGQVQIAGTKFREKGPILITHWGLSGPAVIKLSAWAAEYLFGNNYNFVALVNWIGGDSEEKVRTQLEEHRASHPKQKIVNQSLFDLPFRLWVRLCELAEVDENRIWSEISKKHLNRLIENLVRCPFQIKGKTTFKEEFVTCGGVKLGDINLSTMESKKVPGIYFAGEVLNIDGETGGFNFQSAWTTSYMAAKAMAEINPL